MPTGQRDHELRAMWTGPAERELRAMPIGQRELPTGPRDRSNGQRKLRAMLTGPWERRAMPTGLRELRGADWSA